MKIVTKTIGYQFASIILMLCFYFMNVENVIGQSTDWVAPKSAENLKNPFAGKEAVLQTGKKLYTQLCSICHGDKGKGDGIASLSLKPKPGNFTSTKVQQQSDGAIFWKLTNGRAPMASYKESLTDEKRWQLVTYLRSFKK